MYLGTGTLLHNRYVVENLLGHGGFGITYAALDKVLNVKVAIKEYLPRQLATRAEGQTKVSIFTGESRKHYEYGLRKFLAEAQSVAQFSHHPNIVSARDYFEGNGTAYMVMEYVEGVTLKEYLAKKGGRLAFEEAKGIMMPVMDALREVHHAGMLHRDISPDNIYITSSAQVKILDFGAARYFAGEQSKSLSVILKSGYAPEEQYRSSGKQGAWTDVYAVGATIYKALTGQAPPDALDRMAQDTLVPPSRLGVAIPPPAERALLQALAVSAVQRFQNMEAFQQALLGDAPMTMQFQPAPSPFQPGPGPVVTFVSAPPPVSTSPAAKPTYSPQLTMRPRNIAAIAAIILVTIILGAKLIRWGGITIDEFSQRGDGKPHNRDPLDRFQVGKKWTIDWQSMFRYEGVLQVKRQLAANRYLTRITVSFFNNKNKHITVSMDGRLTIRGKDVVINCGNASESWWDTDDFYLKWQDDTMTGYNIDKKGRKGNAVFRFVEGSTEAIREQQPALSQDPGIIPSQGGNQKNDSAKEDFLKYAVLGDELRIKGNYSKAIAYYGQAINLIPDFGDWIYNNRGLAYLQLGNYQRAVADFDHALQLNPSDGLIYNNRAVAYKGLNDFHRSYADLVKAKQLGHRINEKFFQDVAAAAGKSL